MSSTKKNTEYNFASFHIQIPEPGHVIISHKRSGQVWDVQMDPRVTDDVSFHQAANNFVLPAYEDFPEAVRILNKMPKWQG